MACAMSWTDTAIVMAEINSPTPTSEDWTICSVCSPQAGAGCVRPTDPAALWPATAHADVPTEEPP